MSNINGRRVMSEHYREMYRVFRERLMNYFRQLNEASNKPCSENELILMTDYWAHVYFQEKILKESIDLTSDGEKES